MITSVDTVMVGKTAPASYTNVASLVEGDVALFDQNRQLITTAASAVDATSLVIGVKHNGVVEYSNEIQESSKPKMVYNGYTAPVNSVATVDLTDATIVTDNRYVLRILYKDIESGLFQFTHTYEVIATNATAATLVSAFATKVNNHANRRVNASIYTGVKAGATIGGIAFQAKTVGEDGNDITVTFAAATTTAAISVTGTDITITPKTGELALSNIQALIAGSTEAAALIVALSGTATGSVVAKTTLTGGVDATPAVLTLTAMAKDDNDGVNSVDEYSIVDMRVSMYYTEPNKFMGNVPKTVNNSVITVTAGNPGKGFWKQIRDAENRQAGAKQTLLRGAYPEMQTTHYVVDGQTYDYIVIGCENEYLSCDNQYVKNTPITVELYVNAGQLAPQAGDSIVKKGIEAFITGVAE